MSVRQDKLHRMFQSDSRIMLASLETLIAEFERGDRSAEKLDRAFRAAHSLKSEAGFLELPQITEAAHHLEDTLSDLRSGSGELPGSLLGRQLAHLSKMIEAYRKNHDEFEATKAEQKRRVADQLVREETHQSDDRGDRPAGKGVPVEPEEPRAGGTTVRGPEARGMLREARQRNERLFRVVVEFTGAPEMRYPRAFLVMNNLELVCAVVDVSPSLESLQDTPADTLTLMVTTSDTDESVRKAAAVDEVEVVEITELAYDEVVASVSAVPGESRPSSGQSSRSIQVSPAAQDEIGLLADEIYRTAGEIAELDFRSETGRDAAPELARLVFRHAAILRQEVNWTTRVQLLDVFRDLRRRSTTYAAHQGKRVRLNVTGAGAAVSSAVADILTDAVLHLIRNSIDHGIEPIQVRAQKGKPPAGAITIQAEKVGAVVLVTVSDDGVGIDESAVRERAGDQERSLVDILASPGFTTRDHPDEGSGRGVGLDSVMHTVRDLLSGSMTMRNVTGRGVSVQIKVSSRSRITNVTIADSHQGLAAIPTSSIIARDALDLRRLKHDSFGVVYYDYHGETLPAITVLGTSPDFQGLTDQASAIIVRTGSERRVVVVDRVVAEEAVVRDYENPRRVYSKTLGREVPFVFPHSAFR